MERNNQVLKVLVLSPLKEGSGNRTTALRIYGYFAEGGGLLADSAEITSSLQLREIVENECVDVVLALQAYHCAPALRGYSLPYILIFGGTDVNTNPTHTKKLATMTAVVDKARYLIGFTEEILRKAMSLWPYVSGDRYRLIPQGISVSPSSFHLSDHLSPPEGLGHLPEYLALVVSIRPVKDPLFLVKHFSEWYCDNHSDVILVIVGPVMDQLYGMKFFEAIDGLPGVHYLENLSLEDTHAVIAGSLALVNSSISEGMSAAILEAMALKVPVLARDIPGNRGLVTDGETGLLYATPQEFISKLGQLRGDLSLRVEIVKNAEQQVNERHNCTSESKSYHSLISTLMTN